MRLWMADKKDEVGKMDNKSKRQIIQNLVRVHSLIGGRDLKHIYIYMCVCVWVREREKVCLCVSHVTITRCNDIQSNQVKKTVTEKSLVSWWNMKQEWEGGMSRIRHDVIWFREIGLIWFRLRMRKMRDTRKGVGKGKSPLYNEQGSGVHVFLKCYET